MTSSEGSAPPVLRVVRGDPTPEELAALIAVVAARAATSGPASPPAEIASGWAARRSGVRRPLHTGPGAWRASGSPTR